MSGDTKKDLFYCIFFSIRILLVILGYFVWKVFLTARSGSRKGKREGGGKDEGTRV